MRHLMTHSRFRGSDGGPFCSRSDEAGGLSTKVLPLIVFIAFVLGTLAVYSNYGAAPGRRACRSRGGDMVGLPSAAFSVRSAWRRRPIVSPIRRASRQPVTWPEPMAAEVLAKTTNGFLVFRCLPHATALRIRIRRRSGRNAVGKRQRYGQVHAGAAGPRSSWPMRVLKVETALALRQPLFANTPELGGDAARIRPERRVAAALASVMAERSSFRNRQWRSIPTKASRFSFPRIRLPAERFSTASALLLDLAYPMTFGGATSEGR